MLIMKWISVGLGSTGENMQVLAINNLGYYELK
jgi:hypothetical protein